MMGTLTGDVILITEFLEHKVKPCISSSSSSASMDHIKGIICRKPHPHSAVVFNKLYIYIYIYIGANS